MPLLSSDAVRALGAPDAEVRLGAMERAGALAMPTAEEEVWRYSRIGELDLDEFAPGRAETNVVGLPAPSGASSSTADSNGDLDDHAPHDLFAELNSAFSEPVVIRVPAGTTIEDPILVTHVVSGDGVAVFPRLVIEAGADSDVTVVERFLSRNGDRSLVVPRLELRADQAARVRYLGVNMLNTATWQIGHQRAVGARDSNTLLATVALGGDYARVRTDARLVGQGGTTRQIALYYADGNQMHDFRTLQDHAAPKTNSDLLFKGAVQDRAKSVYTGLIKIRHQAKGSVAFQTNRNLTLSEGAWAESVPNLDIDTNDVKCSHASTIGPIDEEQRFYLESRGIPPEIAERLVVLGFFDEVLDQMPVGPFAAELRRQVGDKLSRRTS